MQTRRVLLVATVSCLALLTVGWAFLRVAPEVTLEFSQAQLQEQLAPKFPTQRCMLTACIELRGPKIALQDGSDKVGIETNFVATFGTRSMPGSARLEGKPNYEQATGKFFLREVNVIEFNMSGNAPDFNEVVKVRGPVVMAAIMNNIPLYSVNSHPKYGAIANHTLRSVQVVGGKLQVVFVNPLLLLKF